MNTGEDDENPRTKVGTLIETYGFEGYGDELERMWTTSGEERKSLRDLAAIFNKRIFESRIQGSEMSRLSTDIDDMYRRLTGEKGTAADQTRIQRQLEREGIDVETLRSDFVSYGAIRSFLKEERSAEHDPNRDPIKRDTDSIQQLRARTMVVTETKLNGLVENDRIELGSHEVTVDINVFCEDCGRQFDVIDILEREECGCNN